jgi:hypothetical protein
MKNKNPSQKNPGSKTMRNHSPRDKSVTARAHLAGLKSQYRPTTRIGRLAHAAIAIIAIAKNKAMRKSRHAPGLITNTLRHAMTKGMPALAASHAWILSSPLVREANNAPASATHR